MLQTETPQNMNETLHKPKKRNNVEIPRQPALGKALQQPLLLAPPPTPSKKKGSTASDAVAATELSSPYFPDHLRCGEVFTWHCEGEFYAVECRLCDDHPLCPLSEFPLHMEAWHTDWSGKLTIDGEDLDEDDDGDQNDLYHVLSLSPLNEDSGLCDYDHEHSSFESSCHRLNSLAHEQQQEDEDGLEPFEQVLIEQDNTVDTTQANDQVEDRVSQGKEKTAPTTTTVIVAAVAAASSSSSSSPKKVDDSSDHHHQQQSSQQQHHKSKQYTNTNEHFNEISLHSHSHTATEDQQQQHQLSNSSLLSPRGESVAVDNSEDIRELREYLVEFENKKFTLSERAFVSDCELSQTLDLKADGETQVLKNNDGEIVTDSWNLAKEIYNQTSARPKQEIPQTAGEIVNPQQQQSNDLQLFTVSASQFEQQATEISNDLTLVSRLADKLPNTVEITSVEILNLPLNSFSPRKRKLPENPEGQQTERQAENALRPSKSPKTEKELLDDDLASKRRKTYTRACKKSLKNNASPKITFNLEDQEDCLNETNSNCDTPQAFLSPASQSPASSICSESTESRLATSSSNSDKASKIRYLVKQCERIAREHQSTESASTSPSSSKSSPGRPRRRRSLTPVEVCDILPTVPLNEHNIALYNTENMSPQTLSEHLESLACSLLDYDDFPDDDRSVASTTLTSENIIESSPSSPGSPNSEVEHFEFHEPKEKLNKTHVSHLIELYKEHSRLWDQTHTEFCEPQLCRQSWQDITDRWNAFCNRKFTIIEVRIRISTLCQRYLKERERIQREGELDESAKFPYYEKMLFLEQHRSLQKRREVYEQQNEKILEIYQKYLVLWHVRWYKVRQVKERTKAFQSISAELKEIGIYLSSTGVQKRIRSLRKCYRLEKIRHLHAQVERIKFEPTFKHYERMQFLDKHIDPFVCRICGKIFESLVGFKEHVESVSHGNILEEEDEDDDAEDVVSTASIPDTDAVLCGTNEKFEISMKANNQNSVSVFIKPLSVAQEVEIYTSSLNAACDTTLSSLPIEDQIIEELIENVANEDEFATKSLDTYLHSSESSEDVSFYIESAGVHGNDIIEINPACSEVSDDLEDSNIDVDGRRKALKRPEVIPIIDGSSKYGTKTKVFAIDEEYHSGDGDTQSARLSDDEIRSMISIYRKYRQLWDPNHLDFNSRSLRRQAWFALTTEFNKSIHRNFSWRSLYRKLIDYAKYYKKLTAEQSPNEIKWIFYQDLMFLDDVIAVSNELAKSIHQRDTTLKLIEIYKDLPQLWNIRDPDFNKRPVKQRNINIMCNRLQEETNQQINPERIKNRLIELRTQYRTSKKKRLRCVKNKQKFFAEFEYYEEFNFIDAHIDPFECDMCSMDFKKLTDFNNHVRKEHEPKRRRFRNVADNDDDPQRLENVCHICGVKFSNRGNLAHHLIRHEGIRNFECSICPKKFFTSHSLKIHVRTHTKEFPYICEKCGLSFVNASKLNQHVLRHSNKKDFKCDHCPKAFYTAFERDRHTRWHLNIRDKDCPTCGKSFVKGSSYYAHLMLHSDKKRFECDKCEMKFAQYAGLYKHKKRYHST